MGLKRAFTSADWTPSAGLSACLSRPPRCGRHCLACFTSMFISLNHANAGMFAPRRASWRPEYQLPCGGLNARCSCAHRSWTHGSGQLSMAITNKDKKKQKQEALCLMMLFKDVTFVLQCYWYKMQITYEDMLESFALRRWRSGLSSHSCSVCVSFRQTLIGLQLSSVRDQDCRSSCSRRTLIY